MLPPESPLPHAHPSSLHATTPPSARAAPPSNISSSPSPPPYSPVFASLHPGHGIPPSIFNRPITPPPRPPTPPLATPPGQIWWYGCGRAQPKDLAIAESSWTNTDESTKRKDSKRVNLERTEQRRRLYNGSLDMSPTTVGFVAGYLERYLEPEDSRRVLARVNDGEWSGRHLGEVQMERMIKKEVLASIERSEDIFSTLQVEDKLKGPEETGKFYEDKPVIRTLWPVVKGSNTAGNVAIAKKEDDELRKRNYSRWWLKHDDKRIAREKQEAEEWNREMLRKMEQEEEDDAGFWNDEEDEEDEENEENEEAYLVGVRMEQIRKLGETDRIGRRYDLDGDLIAEPEPDFWTTRDAKDVPPMTERR